MTDDDGALRLRRNQALELVRQNHFVEAESELLVLTSLLPNDRLVWLELGRARLSLGRHSEAADCLRKAVELGPGSAEDLYLLGVATQSSGNSVEAISYYKRALQLAPDSVELNIRLGSAYTGLDDDKAVPFFRRVLARQPDHSAATISLAGIRAYKGDAAGAYQLLAPLLRKKPLDLWAAAAFADICRPLQRCQEAIDLLEETLSGKHDTESRSRAHFALGKLYDQQAGYTQAFGHYSKGNILANRHYNPAQDASLFKGMISDMDSAFFARTPRAQEYPGQKRPVFIVGMPRSGTTLVEQILASHPSVHAAGELGELGTIAASLPAEVGDPLGYPSCLSRINAGVLDKLASRYLEHVSDISPASADLVIDKMPDNFRFLGFMELLFPAAIIIHCRRAPMDTCLSCYFQNFEGGHPYSYDLRNLGAYYRMHERLMDHWGKVLGLSIMEVEYEKLVEDPERLSRLLIDFCGLEWAPECLQYYDEKRSVKTASFDQVRQPVYRHSVGRWKNYEEYLQPLREGLALRVIE